MSEPLLLLLALVDEPEPLTHYFIGLKVDRLVSDDEMCALADDGLVSVWARWWKDQSPSSAPAYALTERGKREIEAPGE